MICALELIEHIPNVFEFLKCCHFLLKTNGILVISTINKTIKSYLLTIFLAEHLFKIIPKNTHRFDWYQKPENVTFLQEKIGFRDFTKAGMIYSPFEDRFYLSRNDSSVNYIMSSIKF
ncbi:hypothetical protein MHBO_004245 [Bonamia ostreae]|uniref:3-demethylubiquinone-9 3-methyltransferase n=1 Tax=Bonamia ostreae TaxID=126728 RepID=A0ABV2ASV5_9EUKA